MVAVVDLKINHASEVDVESSIKIVTYHKIVVGDIHLHLDVAVVYILHTAEGGIDILDAVVVAAVYILHTVVEGTEMIAEVIDIPDEVSGILLLRIVDCKTFKRKKKGQVSLILLK